MQIQRISAFTRDPAGGNPAGVVIGERLPDEDTMQRVAAEVGYSETAFLAVVPGASAVEVRYFSPEREVAFCGHATIASAVALAEEFGVGAFEFRTRAGVVPVRTSIDNGSVVAALTSVTPQVRAAPDELPASIMPLLGWSDADIDPDLAPALSYAGAWHLVVGVRSSERLSALDYDFDGVRSLMLQHDLTTLQLVHRTGPDTFRARNPFPVGGVVEDPATGAAAAALGAYLRHFGLVQLPAAVTVTQGVEMGRPSTIRVVVPPGDGGIEVSGHARRMG